MLYILDLKHSKPSGLCLKQVLSSLLSKVLIFNADFHAQARNIKRKESTNDVEANIIDDEGDEVMVDVEEAIEGQPEVNGVSNQLIKTLNITKDGSSRSIDVLSDSTAQESFLEVISIFAFAFQ